MREIRAGYALSILTSVALVTVPKYNLIPKQIAGISLYATS